MVYLPGDLPHLRPNAIAALLAPAEAAPLVLARGAHDGTNGIVVASETPFRFQLGAAHHSPTSGGADRPDQARSRWRCGGGA